MRETFLDISDKADSIPIDNVNLAVTKLLFLKCASKEIALTVWGMIQITRSFIFAMFRTILTYSVLFRSLQYSMNNHNFN